MDWTERILLERKYEIGATKLPVLARVGFPRPTEHDHEWACSFQLMGWKDDRVQAARGVDGLQALTIAVTTIRQWLDSAGNVSSSANEAPYEVVFPRFIPFAHGLEYHRHLCRVLDAEIEKKEREIEQKHSR